MTQNEIDLIAKCLKESKTDKPCQQAEAFAQYCLTCVSVADLLAKSNDHFDRDLFMKDCGIEL